MLRIGVLLAGLLTVSSARGQAPTATYQIAVSAGPSWPLLSFAAANGGKGTARPGQYLTVAGTYQPGVLGGCLALTASRYRVDEAAALRQLDPAAPAPAALVVTAPWTTLSLLAGPQFLLAPTPRLRLAFRPLLVGAIIVGAPGYATGAGTPASRALAATTAVEWAWQTGAVARWQVLSRTALQLEVTYAGARPRLAVYGAGEARQLVNTLGLGAGVSIGLGGQ